MARFLRLTNAHPDWVGQAVMVNIDTIASIMPYQKGPTSTDCPEANTSILTIAGIIYHVMETFNAITDNLPI